MFLSVSGATQVPLQYTITSSKPQSVYLYSLYNIIYNIRVKFLNLKVLMFI